MTEDVKMADLQKRIDELQAQIYAIRELVMVLLPSDMVVADVAVSLAGNNFSDARESLEKLRQHQVAAYKRLEELL